MKTIKQIKDEVANEQGYGSFDGAIIKGDDTFLINDVAKRYAEEALKEAAEKVKVMKTGNSGSWFDASVDKNSILNLINELK